MRKLILAALISVSAASADAQTMGPHNGPICRGPGPIIVKPTPLCGATSIAGGLFRHGRFQKIYRSTPTSCIPEEIFLGCTGT